MRIKGIQSPQKPQPLPVAALCRCWHVYATETMTALSSRIRAGIVPGDEIPGDSMRCGMHIAPVKEPGPERNSPSPARCHQRVDPFEILPGVDVKKRCGILYVHLQHLPRVSGDDLTGPLVARNFQEKRV